MPASTHNHLTFRPLEVADFPMFAAWLTQPHVQAWWREPATVQHVSQEYGACTRGDFTTRVYVVQVHETPIGILQTYMLDDYPDYAHLLQAPGQASIDYFIGEQAYLKQGYGRMMIKEFVQQMIPKLYPGATGVATSVEVGNEASLATLQSAGFRPTIIVTGDYGTPEQVMTYAFSTER